MNKKVVWLPYDFDTAIGINNEGSLVFDYELEDTDHLESGADIFNGQESVVWCNIRDAFKSELAAMYQTLRSTGALSYNKVEEMFESHQAKWSEAIFNEDAWFKYIDPLVEDGSGAYLSMLQGSKAEQRKWWLYNRFRYIDSKYNAGDALSDLIQLRGYAKANITVVPYADIYPSVKYGSYLVQKRGKRGVSTTLECPLDNVNDTEIYIYSASQLASVGDLSGLQVGFADFSMATKLQSLKIGDSDENFSNTNLTELYLGNNVLLKTIDVRNCAGLGTGDMKTVDISGCTNVEEVYFEGTKVTGVTLPVGGVIKKLHLPNTITNLTIINHNKITDLSVSVSNVTTLRIENVPLINVKTIVQNIPDNTRLRLIGFSIEASDATEISALFDKFDRMRGLDEYGNNVETAQISGTIHTSALTGTQIAEFNSRYPYVKVTADHTTSYLRYYTYDGSTLLYTETIQDGGNGGAYTGTPSRSATAANTFTFIGWSKSQNATSVDSDALKNVVADRNVYAAYSITGRTYRVRFINNGTTLQTYDAIVYGGSATYTGSEPVYTGSESGEFRFSGWSPSGQNITGDTDCYAQFTDMSSIVVKYLRGTATEYTSDVNTGTLPTNAIYQYSSITKIKAPVTKIESSAFSGSSNITTIELSNTSPVTIAANAFNGLSKLESLIIRSTTMSTLNDASALSGNKIAAGMGAVYVPSDLVSTYKADSKWKAYYIASIDDYPLSDYSTISDTWAQIFAAESDGTYKSKYKIGDTKVLSVNNEDVYMQIVAMDVDELSDGSGKAKITWLMKNQLSTTHNMNSTATTEGGWASTAMRSWLRDTILPTIDSTVRSQIKEVTKTYKDYGTSSVLSIADTVWIPSHREIFNSSSYEDSGVIYSDVFASASDRIKYRNGSATIWWLRSAYSSTNFRIVYDNGSEYLNGANFSYGVVLGFCT